ncbi:MAG: hypothetical protein ACREUG_18400, partial [Steroidobacteraceae bacterium]
MTKNEGSRAAVRSFAELLRFLAEQEYADPLARAREIQVAINRLAHSPCHWPAVVVRSGMGFRRLVVSRRWLVYYVYVPSSDTAQPGCVSIRTVKHGIRRRPFEALRNWPPGTLGPRPDAEVAVLTFRELVEELLQLDRMRAGQW